MQPKAALKPPYPARRVEMVDDVRSRGKLRLVLGSGVTVWVNSGEGILE
jgi:hypothetical protein